MASAAASPAMAGLRDAAASGSASRLAGELLALFEHVAAQPDRVQWVSRHVTADLRGPLDIALNTTLDPALERACSAVAAAIDAQPATFDRHSYHNRQHFCEVALTAYSLCLLNRLGVESTQLVLLAALIHDAVHEGRPQPAFIQERASVDSMRPLLEAAGLDATQIGHLLVLVLATDPASGIAYMSAALRAHAGGGHNAPLAAPAEAPELAALVSDGQLAQLARLLCEADVLPSIGLDPGYATRVQQRLAHEWGRPLGPSDKLAFVDFVLQQGYIGDVFLPCVHATRAALSSGPDAVAQD